MTYGLTFGDLDWSPNRQAHRPVKVRVIGLRRGDVAPTVEVIESLAGPDERITGYENRDQSVLLVLRGENSQQLADYEALITAECLKARNELVWTPFDGVGRPGVYEILWAKLEQSDEGRWDLKEKRRGDRYWVLTLRARPCVRSVEEYVSTALPAGTATDLVIADGASAAGWTGGQSVTSAGGALRQNVTTEVQRTPDQLGHSIYSQATWNRTGPIEITTGRSYLAVEWSVLRGVGSSTKDPVVTADGQSLRRIATETVDAAGRMRSTYLCADPTIDALQVVTYQRGRYVPGDAYPGQEQHTIHAVRATATPPGPATGRQSLRAITVQGSMPTEGSVSVEHETQGLGDVLFYTCPDLATGYDPSLAGRRTDTVSSTTSPDSVSGRLFAAGTYTHSIPVASLPRGEGTYLILAHLQLDNGVNTTPTWEVSTKVGTRLSNPRAGAPPVPVVGDGTLNIVTLGAVTLPTTRVPAGSNATLELAITLAGAGARFDLAWLFYLGDDASLIQVPCGSGAPALGTVHNRLWLDGPTLTSEPLVALGTNADRSDSFYAGDLAADWSVPALVPPTMTALVVSTGATNPAVRVRHHQRDQYHVSSERR